jgi:hypothetical protein
MGDSDLRFFEIRSRLEKLERENRRLKSMGGLAALVAVSLFLMGQAKPDRTLEAERFVLKDASGNVGAELAIGKLGPKLTLNDANGHPSVTLVGGDAPFLTLTLGKGEKQINLSTGSGEPVLHLMDLGVGAATLSLGLDGPNLELWDRQGSAILGRAVLATSRAGEIRETSAASLVLFDKDKKVLWAAP